MLYYIAFFHDVNHSIGHLFNNMLGIAVNTAIYALFPVNKAEFVNDLLLHRSNAAGIFALDNALQMFGQSHVVLLFKLAVFNNIHGDIAVNVSENVEIQVNDLVDFDYILKTVLFAFYVLNNGHAALDLIKAEKLINFHALACADVIQDYSVSYAVNVHSVPPLLTLDSK